VTDRAIRIWLDAAEQLLDDARRNVGDEAYFELVDLVKGRLARCGRRRPEFAIRFPFEGPIVVYLDTESDADADRLRFWLRSNDDYAALVDSALLLSQRERERRRAA
jgi:hypothetical protein